MRRCAGQATVELVALLPLVVLVTVAVVHLLAAGAARELAAHAAQAGAMALLQGEDPEDAARAAVPGWSRTRATVRVDGRRVTVRLQPPALITGLEEVLATTRSADAGPAPGAGRPSLTLVRATAVARRADTLRSSGRTGAGPQDPRPSHGGAQRRPRSGGRSR